MKIKNDKKYGLSVISRGSFMWKFFFYHQWQYKKAEKYLENMEAQGFRLEKAKFAFFFKFRKSMPKTVKYIFIYHFVKDYGMRIYNARQYILGACKGNQVCGKKNGEQEIYRVTDMDKDLDEVYSARQ